MPRKMATLNREDVLKVFGIRLPHWAIVVLWTMGILTMSSLTIKDLCPIVREYYDVEENTQVRIRARRADEEFPAPDLHFCIPLSRNLGGGGSGPSQPVPFWGVKSDYERFVEELLQHITIGSACPLCGMLATHSFDVWNRVEPVLTNETIGSILTELFKKSLDGLKPPSDPMDVAERRSTYVGNTLRDRFVDAFMMENATEVRRVAHITSWSRIILVAVVEYLLEQAEAESFMLANFVSNSSNVITKQRPTKQRLDAVYSQFIQFMCQLIDISDPESVEDRDQGSNICQDTLGNSSLFFRDPAECFYCVIMCTCIPPSKHGDNLYVSIRSEYFDQYISGVRGKFLVFADNPFSVTVDQVGVLPQIRLYETPQIEDLSELQSEEVTLAYSLRSSVIEERPDKLKVCYDESSKAECELACWVNRLESICGCRMYAYGWRSVPSPRPLNADGNSWSYCEGEEYLRCQERLSSTSGSYDCASKCVDACRSYNTDRIIVSSSKSAENRSKEFKLRIERRRQSYLEFTTKVKDTSEDLISQIGGVLNFYLGLSGLSIICFAIHLVESARRYTELRRKGQVGGEDPTKAVGAWRWRWAQLLDASATASANKMTGQQRVEKAMDELSQKFETSERAIEDEVRKNEERMEQRFATVEKNVEAMRENTADIGKAIQDLRNMLDRKRGPKRKSGPKKEK